MKKQLVLLFLICSAAIQAQPYLSPQVISSGGGYTEGTGLSLSYTIGEIAVETLTQGSLILTQGFQQPLDLGTFNPESLYPDWQVKTWPNPVVKDLFLQLGPDIQKDLILETYDLTGKLHIARKINAPLDSDPYTLDLSNLNQGMYILNIRSTDYSLQRIVKIQKQ